MPVIHSTTVIVDTSHNSESWRERSRKQTEKQRGTS